MSNNFTGDDVLNFIHDKSTEIMRGFGIKPNVIASVSLALSDGMAAAFGGQLVYFKIQQKHSIEERNLAIVEDFESGNYSTGELSRKYGLSLAQIYKIIKSKKHEPNS